MTTVQERLVEADTRAWTDGQTNTEAWFQGLGVDPADWEWCGSPRLLFHDAIRQRKFYLIGDVRVYGLRYQLHYVSDDPNYGICRIWCLTLRRVVKVRPWIIPNKMVRIYGPDGGVSRDPSSVCFLDDLRVHPDRV